MPVAAAGNVVAAAPVAAARGCLAVVCAGFVWLLNMWLFCAAVASLVIACAACGAACPDLLVLAATSLAATALVLALLSFAAALLLGCFVLDRGAREQMVAAAREAVDGGRRAAAVGKMASLIFASIGILAFTVKVYPPLKPYESITTVFLDAAALCTSAVCCFVVIPTFGIRMWRRI